MRRLGRQWDWKMALPQIERLGMSFLIIQAFKDLILT